MNDAEIRVAIERLLADYAHYIDADRLEEWLDFFVEDCVYKIVPRENHVRNLPLSLMLCENKDMLRDRVQSLRKANIYNIHTDRHLVSAIRVVGESNGDYQVEANYAVFQTSQEGETRIFSAGQYLDTVTFVDGAPKFKQKLVVSDTAAIHTLLATPI